MRSTTFVWRRRPTSSFVSRQQWHTPLLQSRCSRAKFRGARVPVLNRLRGCSNLCTSSVTFFFLYEFHRKTSSSFNSEIKSPAFLITTTRRTIWYLWVYSYGRISIFYNKKAHMAWISFSAKIGFFFWMPWWKSLLPTELIAEDCKIDTLCDEWSFLRNSHGLLL